MPAAFPSWKTKCANLAENRNIKEIQSLAFCRLGVTKRERGRNKPPNCKTKTAAQDGPLSGGNTKEKHSSAFKGREYNEPCLTAIEKRFPIIARHVGFDVGGVQ